MLFVQALCVNLNIGFWFHWIELLKIEYFRDDFHHNVRGEGRKLCWTIFLGSSLFTRELKEPHTPLLKSIELVIPISVQMHNAPRSPRYGGKHCSRIDIGLYLYSLFPCTQMHCFLSNLFAYMSLFVAMIFTRTAVLEGGDGGGGGAIPKFSKS